MELNRGGAETRSNLIHDALTEQIIGTAIEVHRALVGEAVVVLKAVERLLPVHDAQLLTYMKLAQKEVGLIFNFFTDLLTRGGVVRKALSKPSVLRASATPR